MDINLKNLFYKILTIVVIFIFFVRCDYFENVYWKDGVYEITDSPVIPNCKSLFYVDHGRVDFVTKIGSNKKYIIIESKDENVEYWIINKSKDNQLKNHDEIVEGPFDSKEFIKVKAQNGISTLRFEKDF